MAACWRSSSARSPARSAFSPSPYSPCRSFGVRWLFLGGGEKNDHVCRQRQGSPFRAAWRYPFALGDPRGAGAHRHEVRLRHRAMRRLHRACQRQPGALVLDAGVGRRGQEGHHHRGPVRHLGAPAAEGVGRRAGAAMRLLPVRADHAGGGAAGEEQAAVARADREPHERQHLPLRHLQPHRARHPARVEGGVAMLLETKIGRRGFIKTAGALTFSFTFAGQVSKALAQDSAAKFNAWVTIGADGKVTVMMPAAEMGQGTLTALPLILAEELDADWSKVTYQYAPPNPKIYGNYHPLFAGAMLTAASVSTPGYWMSMRMGGAQARRVLLDNVARQWSVPVEELTTEPSVVVHAKSGRRIAYGDVVKFATVPAEPPQITEADLKKPAQFRLIGRKDIPRVDVPSKVDGSAKYGIDVRLPGMLYASVLEAPYEGAKAAQVNTEDAMKVPGVKKVLPLPFGVAVLGDTVNAARKGRAALKVSWDAAASPNAAFDSEKALQEYASHARDPNAKAMPWFEKGDAPKALAGAAKKMEAEYSSVHCYHAQMEPMNCVARVAADGQ